MPDQADHFLLICTTCKGARAAGNLRQALAACLPAGYTMRAVDCMAGCDHPVTVGFQAPGKAQYLFGDIGISDAEALAEFADQYQRSRDGWTSATQRPAALYHKTLSRLPAPPAGARV